MRVFVTGVGGQLGHDVMKELFSRGIEGIGSDLAPVYTGSADAAAASLPYESCDITDAEAVKEVLGRVRPDAVIHCAAWTAVDAAEDPANREKVFRINAQGTANIAACCRQLNAKMLYLSTDYVFDGSGSLPWQIADRTCPLNVYGMSKLQGEEAVRALLPRSFILRTSWVFGAGGRSFVSTMLRLGQERQLLQVVNDQVGSPTYTLDLAQLIADMIVTDRYGVYHASNEGYCSFAEFARAILQLSGSHSRVQAIASEEYPCAARRPRNSRLSKQSLDEAGFRRLPPWEDALRRFLAEYPRT